MMVQVRYTNGLCHWLQASELKVSANGKLYSSAGSSILAVDEVLNYASIN